MTANLEQLLPGAPVLLDTGGMWAGRILRGQRGVVVHRFTAGIGDGAEVAVCIGPCDRSAHTIDCHSAVAFQADELLLIPANSETLYTCCSHGDCPDHCPGHPVPCTKCEQPLVRTADQQTARDMAAGR